MVLMGRLGVAPFHASSTSVGSTSAAARCSTAAILTCTLTCTFAFSNPVRPPASLHDNSPFS
jgi:hypothetical protein